MLFNKTTPNLNLTHNHLLRDVCVSLVDERYVEKKRNQKT